MVPCKECLIIPLCRHKNYETLLSNCNTLHKLLYRQKKLIRDYRVPEFEEMIIEIEYVLQPTKWFTNNNITTKPWIQVLKRRGHDPL